MKKAIEKNEIIAALTTLIKANKLLCGDKTIYLYIGEGYNYITIDNKQNTYSSHEELIAGYCQLIENDLKLSMILRQAEDLESNFDGLLKPALPEKSMENLKTFLDEPCKISNEPLKLNAPETAENINS